MYQRLFLTQLDIEGSISINLASSEIRRHDRTKQDWLVHLMETGRDVSTGGRLMRLKSLLEKETFMMTYGDGVSNVDINALLHSIKCMENWPLLLLYVLLQGSEF